MTATKNKIASCAVYLAVFILLGLPTIHYTFTAPHLRHFVGAGASVVKVTPFLRYMTAFGFIDVSKQSITKALLEGSCVGTVPDGIAGIFRTTAKV